VYSVLCLFDLTTCVCVCHSFHGLLRECLRVRQFRASLLLYLHLCAFLMSLARWLCGFKPLSHMESGNVPYATSCPRQQHSTSAFLPPFSTSTLNKILQKNDSLSLIRVSGLPITIYLKNIYIYIYIYILPNTPNRILAPHPLCTPIHEGSEFKTQV